MKKSKFRVGDQVIAEDGSIGEVIKHDGVEGYPIVVKFNRDYRLIRTYTAEGFQYTDLNVFWIRKFTKLDKALK